MSIAEHEFLAFEEARAIARRRHIRILFPLAVVVIMLAALAGIAIHDYQIIALRSGERDFRGMNRAMAAAGDIAERERWTVAPRR